ncbi:hypothetical protein B0T25DRAFT_602719 [Lasiosphaeria hispida]|uniref:CHAT domain-containing protein n=1 Tax=Lasiosphaeria hispida TaxID=260671 RepID=A0AAJ0HKA7_9PEZI|nr:hypothetical protein B0T25DRAFT_602719 [Lasiosphaeria hispida]
MSTTPGSPKPPDHPGVMIEKKILEIASTHLLTESLDQPSVNELFERLPHCSVAHFAYHGSTDYSDPSNSGLILQKCGGTAPEQNRLTVQKSRGPFAKLDTWKNKIGWTFPWYSSEGSDFNYDFHATLDPAFLPVEYNFANAAELKAKGLKWNSAGAARGLDHLLGTYQLLDMTPLGRQDGPQGPGEFKLKYEYDDDA